MLNLIKQRQAAKADGRNGMSPSGSGFGLVETSRKKKSKSKIAEFCIAGTLAELSTGCDGFMDIEYKKFGSVREKDLGKETVTPP
jgi:hypothetical protein